MGKPITLRQHSINNTRFVPVEFSALEMQLFEIYARKFSWYLWRSVQDTCKLCLNSRGTNGQHILQITTQ